MVDLPNIFYTITKERNVTIVLQVSRWFQKQWSFYELVYFIKKKDGVYLYVGEWQHLSHPFCYTLCYLGL